MNMGRKFAIVVAFTLALAPAAAGLAQTGTTTADVTGVVRDVTDAILRVAQVSIVNAATNITRSVTTDEDGRFTLSALPPGLYSLTVEVPGFVPHVKDDVVLTIGSRIHLDIVLLVAGSSETLTVQAEQPLLDIGRTVSTVVTSDQIENLPINGRNFLSFALLSPAVTTDRTPQQGASATSGLNFGGQHARLNNITIDGVDNNDPSAGGVRSTVSQEAVREFQVLTNSFSAEFGKAVGGVVNIVTKNGTNTLSGNAFFFFRDARLNARDHFERFTPSGMPINPPKAAYRQKQFGGTFGGPLRRDKTFFFASFERLDTQASNFVTIDDQTPVSLFGQVVGTPASLLRQQGFSFETGNVPFAVRSNQLLGKIDHYPKLGHTLSARLIVANAFDENIEPWGGLVAKSRGALLESDDRTISGSYTAVISTRLVTELRGQVAYRGQDVLALDPTCSGPCDQIDEGGPTVEVVGVANAGRQRFTPQPRTAVRYQALQTLTYFAGAHQFKGGVDYNFIDSRDGSLPLHFGGRYVFSALPAIAGLLPAPVSSIQAFAAGLPAAYVQGYGNPASTPDYQDVSVFGEDNWRATRAVSVRLGVRYQRQFWPGSTFNMPGYGEFVMAKDRNNLAPRLTVSWDPFSDGRTSVHGSYGLFFGNVITGVFGASDVLTGGPDGVRTQVLMLPASAMAWRAPSRRLPELGGTASVGFFPDPSLETPYAHHAAVGVNRELSKGTVVIADVLYVRGFDQLGILDYNPLIPALGAGRRPNDAVDPGTGRPIPGSSASVLQYTSFGESWYKAFIVSLTHRRPSGLQLLASYTLSKAEDTSGDFQTSTIPQDTGRGRNPADPAGLPIAFNPASERGPALHDQRHRFVLSGTGRIPGAVHLSAVLTIGSGRPFNILAGADLNGDGNGGSFPTDRARAVPADANTSVSRNSGTMPSQATVDIRVSRVFELSNRVKLEPIFEVFNALNRSNFTEVNNIFGIGAYPSTPLPTFGQFEKAAPPRQAQLAVKLNF
jgi:Carboxypeptidase regulatory-like domain/TonB dependent receptor/TonB-dependent Receptor Plug Domain